MDAGHRIIERYVPSPSHCEMTAADSDKLYMHIELVFMMHFTLERVRFKLPIEFKATVATLVGNFDSDYRLRTCNSIVRNSRSLQCVVLKSTEMPLKLSLGNVLKIIFQNYM